MSDYTKLNLRDVENAAPKFGFPPEMEARFATRSLELEQCGVGLEKLAPGFRIPFGHTHSRQEEVYVVIEGSARLRRTRTRRSCRAGGGDPPRWP
jgi:uncharacterized cupin superfamily protein